MRIRKAVIPAAGLGTRLLPATKAVPKEMLPILDKPTIQYVVEECVDAGMDEILIVVSPAKRAIEEHFHPAADLESHLLAGSRHDALERIRRVSSLASIQYVWQKRQLGLGDAVRCGRVFVGSEPFAVALGDAVLVSDDGLPVLGQLARAFTDTGRSAVALEEVPIEKVHRYGIAAATPRAAGLVDIEDLVEKPAPDNAPSRLAIAARYVLSPEIFDLLADLEPGRNNEIQLTDALAMLARSQGMVGYRFEGRRYDIGDRLDYLKTSIEFALRTPELGQDLRAYLRALLDSG